MDRFEEQAWRMLGDIYRKTSKASALEEDKIARKVIAAALRKTWDAAIRAGYSRGLDDADSIPKQCMGYRDLLSIKSTPPRTNEKGDHESVG